MKAARLFEYDSPLRVVDIDPPKLLDGNSVIVRVKGAGVCHTDLHIIEGVWREKVSPSLPLTLGHENAGVVEEVGEAVSGLFKKGDPVILHPRISCGFCRACRSGEDMHCESGFRFPGLTMDGGFAELMVTSARCLIRADGLDLAEIAPLADAGLTAMRAVKKAVPLAYPGAYVAVVGVGGVGHIAIQLLKHMTNANIIAIDVHPDKLKLAEQLKADYVVDAKKDAVNQVMEITKGKGVNVAIDFVGTKETHLNCFRMLRSAGKLVFVGYGGTLEIKSIDMIAGELTVEGSLVGNYIELVDLIELAKQGKVRVIVSKYKLEEVGEVLERLKKGEIVGRAVLLP
jgi:NAD+-dependent secondary alcohol dehydrogenase Adh1